LQRELRKQISKFGLVLDPEEGGGIFLRNVNELSSDNNATQVTRLQQQQQQNGPQGVVTVHGLKGWNWVYGK
jgi:hypothetical protein